MTREQVIKGLECLADSESGCRSDCPYYKEYDGSCPEKIAVDALALIREQQELLKAREWISVEDRLPEEGEVVLAFGTRSASTGQFQGVGTKPWFWYWKGNTIRRVTHWMPLPEPPKEG